MKHINSFFLVIDYRDIKTLFIYNIVKNISPIQVKSTIWRTYPNNV